MSIPAATGAVARVEIRTSRQSNWGLEVSADASRTDETTRNMEASFVNALPLRPFAKRKIKTGGPESAAIPPSNPPQKPAPRPTEPIIRRLNLQIRREQRQRRNENDAGARNDLRAGGIDVQKNRHPD